MGTPIGSVSASDADIGQNAELVYSVFTNSFASQYFYFDSIYAAGAGSLKIKQVSVKGLLF